MARLQCPACGEIAADETAKFCEACRTPLRGDIAPGARRTGCQCATPKFDEDGYCATCGLKAPRAATPPEHEEAIDAFLAVASDKGRRHPTNQDFGAVARRADGAALLVVADGVSTSDNAEGASRAAVQAVREAFLAGPSAATSLGEQAKACALAAAEAVLAVPVVTATFGDGPASTLVVVIARPNSSAHTIEYGVAWVGDSRVYVVAPSVPETLVTPDDSWRQEQVDAGRMTFEQAQLDKNAHAITQWLGMPTAQMSIHVKESVVTPGSVLLACSDGLWNYADGPGKIGRAYTEASREADAAEICRRLVEFANSSGGADNVTVALLRA